MHYSFYPSALTAVGVLYRSVINKIYCVEARPVRYLTVLVCKSFGQSNHICTTSITLCMLSLVTFYVVLIVLHECNFTAGMSYLLSGCVFIINQSINQSLLPIVVQKSKYIYSSKKQPGQVWCYNSAIGAIIVLLVL